MSAGSAGFASCCLTMLLRLNRKVAARLSPLTICEEMLLGGSLRPEEDIANQLFRQYRAIKMALRKIKPNPTLAPSGKVIIRP